MRDATGGTACTGCRSCSRGTGSTTRARVRAVGIDKDAGVADRGVRLEGPCGYVLVALEAVDPARRKVLRVFRRDRGGLRDGGTPAEQGEKKRPENV